MKRKSKRHGKRLLSILIVSLLGTVTNGYAAYNVPQELKYNAISPGTALTGPLHGEKPWIDKIIIKNAANQKIIEGETLSIDFSQPQSYQFIDSDKDVDISSQNLKWYLFRNSEALMAELENITTARDIEQLVMDGDAKVIELGTAITDAEAMMTVPKLENGWSVGYVITPSTANGYPIRANRTLIVPSVTYIAAIDKDGKPEYTLSHPENLVTVVEYALGSREATKVPPNDFNDLQNIYDDPVNTEKWSSLQLVLKVIDKRQPSVNINLEKANADGHIGKISVTGNYDGSEINSSILTNSSQFTAQEKDNFLNIAKVSISDPVFNAANQSYTLDLASNENAMLVVAFEYSDGFAQYETENELSLKRPYFIDLPSENISMALFDRGTDGKGEPMAVTPEMVILPNHHYEVTVSDNDNLVIGNKATDVTHYFNNYIKWAYAESTLNPQVIALGRCNGTTTFVTQASNENAEQVIKNLAPDIWPNFEQGLRLKPYLELPEYITSQSDGEYSLSATSEPMASCTKDNQDSIEQ